MKMSKPSARTGRNNKQSKRVRFSLGCNGAAAVYLTGTFNNWNAKATPLCRTDNKLWVAELPLPPGTYEYQFVVDGCWTPDPQARESAPNPYGGANSVMHVNAD
jgi:1,4-alpha-glucan branching enzyme